MARVGGLYVCQLTQERAQQLGFELNMTLIVDDAFVIQSRNGRGAAVDPQRDTAGPPIPLRSVLVMLASVP